MATYQAHETAVIDSGCTIGDDTRIWHFSHIMSGCTIGERCNIGQNVVISPEVVLGNNVKVQNNVSVYTGVTCEDDVFLGPSCVFTNVINPRSAVCRKNEYMQVEEIRREVQSVTEKFAGEGRVLIRTSGTEPLVRVMIEGKNLAIMQEEARRLAALIEEKLQ